MEMIKQISSEFWLVFKKYYGQMTDKKWKYLTEELKAFREKYTGTYYESFAKELSSAYMREIERKNK